MLKVPRRFDPYLPSLRVDELRSMAKLWTDKPPTRKEEVLRVIIQGLADPQAVERMIAGLRPFERTALALCRDMGGEIEAGQLALALRASGLSVPASRYPGDESFTHYLIQKGLFLGTYIYSPTYIYASIGPSMIFADERVLAQAGRPEYEPLDLTPVPAPPATAFRPPQTVLLDVIGILQAIRNIGNLQITQSGGLRVGDARKLVRAMGWKENSLEVDGFTFSDPAAAFASVLLHAGLLALTGKTLTVRGTVEDFAVRPYAEQARVLLEGFLKTVHWREWDQPGAYGYANRYPEGRMALIFLLKSLPVGVEGFYSLDDLDQAFYNRVGAYFALGFSAYRPYQCAPFPGRKTPEAENWDMQRRRDWLARERVWMESALRTWLFYLGLVEFGMEEGRPVSLRLTDLGLSVFHPEIAESPVMAMEEGQAAWVVQPNFDIVVYLDRTRPDQLAFLERHAERAQAQQYVAQYKLTRESVYRGLESGSTPADLIAGLQAGAGTELPQNVLVEIREWSARREQITMRRRSALVEFLDAPSRQAALGKGLQGTVVGEKFVLLPPKGSAREWVGEVVDYAEPLPPCITLKDDAIVRLTKEAPDLMVRAFLDRWTEPTPGGSGLFTRESVTAGIKSGGRTADLLKFLGERSMRPVPPLMHVVLKAWAGDAAELEIEPVIVLHCANQEVFQAISTSRKFRRFWRGILSANALLVDAKQLESLRQELAWAGLKISDTLTVR